MVMIVPYFYKANWEWVFFKDPFSHVHVVLMIANILPLTFLQGTAAYVPQQAWIQNASVEDNILFGNEMDEAWFNSVVDACALQPDLESFPAGQKSEIGEKVLAHFYEKVCQNMSNDNFGCPT